MAMPVLNYALIYSRQLGNSRWLAETGSAIPVAIVRSRLPPINLSFLETVLNLLRLILRFCIIY